MRWYLADVIEHALIFACAVFAHAGGCWLLNRSPLRRVYWWAVNVRWNDEAPQHTACPLCRFDRDEYVPLDTSGDWEPVRDAVRRLHYYGYPPDERLARDVDLDVEEVVDLARAAAREDPT